MEKMMNILRGVVRLEISGTRPASLLNACAAQGIEFWGVEPDGEYCVRMKIHKRDEPAVARLSARTGCTAKSLSNSGGPIFVNKIKRRYALLIGLVVCLCLLMCSSFFIWDIVVVGNESVGKGEILNALEECGVEIGSFWPSFNNVEIRTDMLLLVDGLRWITVNASGSRAIVIVRERVEKPEIVDEDALTNVIATKPGIITDITVHGGAATIKEGDTVMTGDMLVSGIVTGRTFKTRAVHASAKINARTWYELTVAAPLTESEKSYTGEEKTSWALIIGENRINFSLNSGILQLGCDKIIREYKLELDGLFILPVWLEKATYMQYDTTEVELDADILAEALKQELSERLMSELGDDGQVVSTTYTLSKSGGMLYVTLRAECTEDIAGMVAMTQEEIHSALGAGEDAEN